MRKSKWVHMNMRPEATERAALKARVTAMHEIIERMNFRVWSLERNADIERRRVVWLTATMFGTLFVLVLLTCIGR
jgi:hypothetical protein